MRSKIVYCVALLALTILVFIPERANGECCYASIKGSCSDCRAPGIGHAYCGKGDCNIFGCNCDYGCRRGSCRKRRSLEDQFGGQDGLEIESGNDVVRLADTDADGALNVTEVKLFLGRLGVLVEIDALRALDADGDGKLTAREIDADIL